MSVRLALLCLLLLGCKRGEQEAPAPVGPPPADDSDLLAPSQPSSPVVGKNDRYFSIGERADLPHFSLRIGRRETCTIEPYLSPKTGSTVLGVEVFLEGRTSLEVPANPFYAMLIGPSGERYESTLAGCKPALRATQLEQGERAEGFVSFVVPQGAGTYKLHYRPAIIGVTDEEARFDLGVVSP